MIADIFIKRPVTAIVTAIVITLLGIVALLVVPVAQYPDITPSAVVVSGTFMGADAESVEQTTTTAIETQVNGTPGMTYMSSNSTSTGTSRITVNFEVGTNIDIAALDVQNRVSIAEPTLPEDVRRLGITVRKRNPSIMMVLAFYSPNGTHNSTFIGNYTNLFIRDALLRIKGVGDIFSLADEFSMRVWLDPYKLAQFSLTPADVTRAIQAQNLQIVMGTVGGMPQISEQTFEYSVLSNSRLGKEAEFGDIIVRINTKDGSFIRLKDVAKIALERFNYNNNAFVNGKPASILLIYQTPDANTLDIYNKILFTLGNLQKNFPKDLAYAIPKETATIISVSIREVLHTFMEALVLVVLVVFLFLQSWRATLIPLLAVPVALIGTFIFFVPLGFTVNTLTMFAFVLSIGIVVDDAIVVVEAVQHYIDTKGLTPKEATIQAIKDISGPVIAIALILAVVFIPVSFIPGISGRMYQQFALTIAISVIISAFVALSLTPALCIMMLKKQEENKKKGIMSKFFVRFNRLFAVCENAYEKAVYRWIKKAPYVVIMMIVLTTGMIFLFRHKPTGFVPLEDEGSIYVTYELPEGTATVRSARFIQTVMDTLKHIPAIQVAAGLAGFNVVNFSNKSNFGTIFIKLKPWSERTQEKDKLQGVIRTIQEKTVHFKEAVVRAIAPPPIPGLGAVSGFAFQLQQRETNDNIKRFEAVKQDFLIALQKRKEIGMAYSFFNTKTPAYHLQIDRDKVQKLGISVADVYTTMSILLAGRYVNDLNIYGRNFKVMVMGEKDKRSNLTDILNYYVRNDTGDMIPFSAFASYKIVETPSVMTHHNIYRSIQIDGNAAAGYSSGEAIETLKQVAEEVLPDGYGYEFSGLAYEEIRAGNYTVYIFAGSVLFVFLFLAAMYESWVVPFSVLFAVPVGLFGSILTLYFIPSLTNNIYAQIGMLTLIGLAAKNAILIVEFAKERTDKGMPVIDATLEAVRLRLRPILMTSLAFILGVFPLTYAEGAASVSRNTIGFTVLGGMLMATSLVIFIVPVFFVLIMKTIRKKTI